nr:DUF6602 domain-containing protein [Thalassobacillus devorans]
MMSDIVDTRANQAGINEHSSSIGTNREIIIEEFLNKHIPHRLAVNRGGVILDLNGKESKQIDIIVKSDLGLNFKEHDIMFDCIESVAAVVSSKSNLTGDTLDQALIEIESIPKMSKKVIELDTFMIAELYKKAEISPQDIEDEYIYEFITNFPSTVIFSYKGMELPSIIKHIKTHYTGKHIDSINIPTLIWVNKKYVISKLRITSKNRQSALSIYNSNKDDFIALPLEYNCDEEIKYIMEVKKLDNNDKGLPFLRMIGLLTSYNTYNNLKFQFDRYFR